MKTGKIILGMAVMATVTFAACSKYEDGPEVSFRSKKERVANTWKIEAAYSNGEDVTEQYDEFTLLMTKDGDAELTAEYSFGDFSFEYETDGTWQFANDEQNLMLDFEDDDADQSYQILRLAEEQLWIRELGGEDELQLMPK